MEGQRLILAEKEETKGKQPVALLVPVETRWNSIISVWERMLRIGFRYVALPPDTLTLTT